MWVLKSVTYVSALDPPSLCVLCDLCGYFLGPIHQQDGLPMTKVMQHTRVNDTPSERSVN